MTFRTRLFVTSLAAAAATLLVATLLISWSVRGAVNDRIERTLAAEVRLAAEALANRRSASPGELDAEADALGRLGSGRVTFIAPDGTVVGDSDLTASELRSVENHAGRPEVEQALREGFGSARRYSATLGIDMFYVAVPVRNPAMRELAVVRFALPLTEVKEQLASVRRVALVALGVGTFTALLLSWVSSRLLTRRMEAIAAAARALRKRGLQPSGPRHWQRRNRHDRTLSRRCGRAARAARERACLRPRPNGSDPQRHDRRRARRQPSWTPAARQRSRAAYATADRTNRRTALPGTRAPSRHRGADHRRARRRHAGRAGADTPP